MKELLMGNEAIGLAALAAGVSVVTGYPGTPSTEVLETIAKHAGDGVHVEWSVNEKSALEVAAGASYAGLRCLVTMKQVGLNVASDPAMSLAYIGVKGGLVLLVADDPGPISSQTEQDTRLFGAYSKLPVFDPCSPEEAFSMVADAFELSERYETPVILRPSTRVCHSRATIDIPATKRMKNAARFIKDPRWVVFPALTYKNHIKLKAREKALSKEFSAYSRNRCYGTGRLGIACGGISRLYVREALSLLNADCAVLEIATPYPFPCELALEFLRERDAVLVIEELDAVIEQELLKLRSSTCITSNALPAGENTAEDVAAAIAAFMGIEYTSPAQDKLLPLPARPPVLCAGCPHRASFYAVKEAMSGKKAFFCGDIGCYTLGNAAPLDMVDTCLCMGAGITMAQGLKLAEPDAVSFAFVGDSTFFHTGIPGIINAVYNKTNIVLIVLDNRTTAMTGHQPHPGTGRDAKGLPAPELDISRILAAIDVPTEVVDPLCHAYAVAAVAKAAMTEGVSAIIFKSPCAVRTKPDYYYETIGCIGCHDCIDKLGCPAISLATDGLSTIDIALCTGCGLCEQVCDCGCFIRRKR